MLHFTSALHGCSPVDHLLNQRLLPVVNAVNALPDSGRHMIAIDGPCGSGKTTLAACLSRMLNCPCVHMDDFHVPHAQKTAQRMAQPGGNSDRERLICEVLSPWKQGLPTSYRPYNCSEDCLDASIALPDHTLLILEGSYSHHPEIAAYTSLQVFVQVNREEQLQRIRLRSPEKLDMFLSSWIPLEDRYFAAFQLPSSHAIVIHNHSVQGM